ncbi:hypothetical protein, unknown function [Leishmania tarentolae]|uniref:Uncharacterized protein n=1 Tax=Leishmania tarentolae TaxID=5689 RepID=A0A640KHH6_LEITA|nr:hypothetical protein, unknown function [Leishmania tarentolae]
MFTWYPSSPSRCTSAAWRWWYCASAPLASTSSRNDRSEYRSSSQSRYRRCSKCRCRASRLRQNDGALGFTNVYTTSSRIGVATRVALSTVHSVALCAAKKSRYALLGLSYGDATYDAATRRNSRSTPPPSAVASR